MNYISVNHCVAISMWDSQKISGNILYRVTDGGEQYWPFMSDEQVLAPKEVCAFDEEKCLCLVRYWISFCSFSFVKISRYRDSKYACVTPQTTSITIHVQFINLAESDLIEVVNQEFRELLEKEFGKIPIV